MTSAPDRIEAELAAFATGLRWGDVPSPASERVTSLVLDSIACALAGRLAPSRDDFARAAASVGGPGGHVVVGGSPLGLTAAVLVNAWQTTALTMCDIYRPTMCHVTPLVFPAALAAAERFEPSRDGFMAAFAAATEVTVRLCSAMRHAAYSGERWHAPGVIGPYGSATAAGLIEGLDDDALRRAWGLAGLQSAGAFSAIGSPAVKFTQARAAAAGVAALEFARAGHGANPNPLTHPDGGLFDAYDGEDPDRAVGHLGERWELLEISLRRWPAASSLQSLVEAVLQLRTDTPPEHLLIELPPQSFKLCAAMGWDTQLSALQSARWMAAVTWIDGQCWTGQFTAERLRDEGTGRLAREAVSIREDAALPQGAVRVTARVGGSESTLEIAAAPGSPGRPLGIPDALQKLESAAGSARAASIAAIVTGDTTWSVPALVGLLAGR
jgi:2-methylcitrate dehydratase PrpD